MPTTSNFGWTTPADTDLVKDGAAAIRTLGNGIDTSFIDLKGGTTGQVLSKASNTDLDYSWVTPNVGDITEVQAGTGISVASGTGPIPVVTNTVATTFDAKGDLVAGTGADTFAKLTVGANDTVLMADSSTATGLKWAAVSSGGMTLLASGNLSSNTLTISSISGAYNDLQLILRDFYMASDDYINIRFNSDTGNNYGWIGFNHTSEDVGSVSADGVRDRMFTSFAAVDNADNNNFAITTIYDYANTSHNKLCQINSIVRDSTNAYFANMSAIQNWRDTSAITSITLFTQNASNFSGGSYVLYGVK